MRPDVGGAPTAIIPLKAVAAAKTRMAPALDPGQRALLLRRTFDRVVQAVTAAGSLAGAVVVVGDDRGGSWATAHGLETIEDPGQGLNAALAAADRALGGRPTLVVPADLPLVTGADLDAVVLAARALDRAVVVVPTADGGTGALLRVPGAVIGPAFGPASAAAHLSAARRAGVPALVRRIAGLALDLDRPADLALAGGWSAITGGRTLPA